MTTYMLSKINEHITKYYIKSNCKFVITKIGLESDPQSIKKLVFSINNTIKSYKHNPRNFIRLFEIPATTLCYCDIVPSLEKYYNYMIKENIDYMLFSQKIITLDELWESNEKYPIERSSNSKNRGYLKIKLDFENNILKTKIFSPSLVSQSGVYGIESYYEDQEFIKNLTIHIGLKWNTIFPRSEQVMKTQRLKVESEKLEDELLKLERKLENCGCCGKTYGEILGSDSFTRERNLKRILGVRDTYPYSDYGDWIGIW